MRLLLSAQGKIKSKASIIIYHGGGERERMKGDHMVFRVTGGETVIAHKVRGGGATEH